MEGVVQVEPLAVLRRDDRVLDEVGVAGFLDAPLGLGQGGAVGAAEGEPSARRRRDQVAAFVDADLPWTPAAEPKLTIEHASNA